MWNWLADNPGEGKGDYLIEFDPEAELDNNCYLCEYVKEQEQACESCPLEWPGESCSWGGLYPQWCNAMECENYTLAAEIARQIAELPEKEEEIE